MKKSSEQQLAYSLLRFIAQTPNSCLMQLSEHLFITVMFPSVTSQSRHKRSAYVSLSSSFSTCPFQSITVFQCVTGTQPHEQPTRRQHAPKRRVRPLRTGLDKCYTPHFQCKSTTRKHKTLLRLTETEHISLFLLSLLYWNSSPHNDTFHTHKMLLCSNSQIPL